MKLICVLLLAGFAQAQNPGVTADWDVAPAMDASRAVECDKVIDRIVIQEV